MIALIITVAAGFAGGLLRATIGVLKQQVKANRRKKIFSPYYFFATFLLAGLLGVIAGLFIADDPRFALLAGYAGTDFIEGLYRVRFRERYSYSKRRKR